MHKRIQIEILYIQIILQILVKAKFNAILCMNAYIYICMYVYNVIHKEKKIALDLLFTRLTKFPSQINCEYLISLSLLLRPLEF